MKKNYQNRKKRRREKVPARRLRYEVVRFERAKQTGYLRVSDGENSIVISVSHNKKSDITWVYCEDCKIQLGRWEGFRAIDEKDIFFITVSGTAFVDSATIRKKKRGIETTVTPVIEAHFVEHYPLTG